jgi:putative transcriptional regulator
MSKELLITRIINILKKAGFIVSERCDLRPRCFDLAARLDDDLLLIKVLSNIDGLKEAVANEVKLLALHLGGVALIVGEKTRDHYLESGVVYLRHGIPTVNLVTFREYFLENTPPLIYAAHGGLYVRIDGEFLREVRLKRNISIGELASELGVSRRTVSKYEELQMDISVELVWKLEEFLNEAFAMAIDLLKKPELPEITKLNRRKLSSFESEVISHIMDMGFEVIPTTQSPFEAISQKNDRDTILTGISDYNANIVKKARIMSSISSIAHTHSLCIVDEIKKVNHIGDTVLIRKKDFEKIDDAEDLTDYIVSVKN